MRDKQLDDNAALIGINAFFEPEKQQLNYAISVQETKRFLGTLGNRGAQQAANPPGPPATNCPRRQFPPFADAVTKKKVVPFDVLCKGQPNLWIVGDPPEYSLWDRVGNGKIDIKIVYRFAQNTDLWIVYGNRDGVPTMFGYDYGRTGKPDRWVPVNAPHQ